MWIIGDRFVTKSFETLRKYLGIFGSQKENTRYDSYIAEHLDMLVFTTDDDHTVKSTLGRIRNALAMAINENDKFPKYIIVVIDADILDVIHFSKPGIAKLLNQTLTWLIDEFHACISDRKASLPEKAKKYMYPQVFWITLPQHKFFTDNQN